MSLQDLHIAVVDTETTGLDPSQNEIIEIAVIIYDQHKNSVIKEWCRKVEPRNIKTASSIALEMNGYNRDPKSYIYNIEDVMAEFVDIINGCVVLGQNINFDVRFIEKYCKEFCLSVKYRKLELSSLVWPSLFKANDMKLSTICDTFNVSNDGEHTALTDCRRTLAVYRKYMDFMGVTSVQ